MVILWCSVSVEKGPCLQVSTWVGGSIQWFLVANMEVLRPYAIIGGLVWSTSEFQYFCRFPVSNWFLGMMILFSFQLQAECSLLRADCWASVPIVLNVFSRFSWELSVYCTTAPLWCLWSLCLLRQTFRVVKGHDAQTATWHKILLRHCNIVLYQMSKGVERM